MPRFWTLHRSTRWTTSREALHSYLTKRSLIGSWIWSTDLGPQLTVTTWKKGIITSHPSVRVNCVWSTPCGPLFRHCLFFWQRTKPTLPACTTYFMIFPSDWQSWTSRWSFMTTANRRMYRIYSTKVCRLIVTQRHLNDIHSFIHPEASIISAYVLDICFHAVLCLKIHQACPFQGCTAFISTLFFIIIIVLQQRQRKTILIGTAFCWFSWAMVTVTMSTPTMDR